MLKCFLQTTNEGGQLCSVLGLLLIPKYDLVRVTFVHDLNPRVRRLFIRCRGDVHELKCLLVELEAAVTGVKLDLQRLSKSGKFQIRFCKLVKMRGDQYAGKTAMINILTRQNKICAG